MAVEEKSVVVHHCFLGRQVTDGDPSELIPNNRYVFVGGTNADQYKMLKGGYKESYAFRDKLDTDGFDQPIRVGVGGLPPGATASQAEIPPGQDRVALTISVPAQAALTPSVPTDTATAACGLSCLVLVTCTSASPSATNARW